MKSPIFIPSTLIYCFLVSMMLLTPDGLEAYPGYGKKINPSLTQSCATCHVMYPKLKQYGRTVKEMGYNIPVYEADEGKLKTFYRNIPLSVRGKIEILKELMKPEVNVKELQLLSAGNVLKNKVSWWFHKHVVEDNKLVNLVEGNPHELWLQYNSSDALHIRTGMFELPMWFSPTKTKVSEIEYLYYGATSNEDNLGLLSSPQFGVQAYGHLKKGSDDGDDWFGEEDVNYAEGYNYAVSVTNGETSFQGKLNTFFARITRKDPKYSVGVFILAGLKETMVMEEMGNAHDNHEDPELQRDAYYRIGTDMDLYLKADKANLYGSFAYGKDIERDFFGGFVAYDRLIKNKLFLSLRYDAVLFNRGEQHEEENHLEDHNAEQNGQDGGHQMHGPVISDDAGSLSFTIGYLFVENVRLGWDFRYGLKGIDNKGTLQIQFAL